jgi:excisionase family DNA binding protein
LKGEIAMIAFLNETQAANLLGISRDHVRRLANKGMLPHLRIGRQLRFEPDLLRNWAREKSLESIDEREGDDTPEGKTAGAD